jgi:hypothetical protein
MNQNDATMAKLIASSSPPSGQTTTNRKFRAVTWAFGLEHFV